MLAWLIAKVATQQIQVNGSAVTIVAILLGTIGIILGISAILEFRHFQTTIDPAHPQNASSLVTTGVFQFTRNPMYLALLLCLAGWVVFLGQVIGLITLLVFWIYITRFQIFPEEQILASRFGELYSHYCSQVRRWI
jgi:protein-S-isoprenylcysteine O-methyltransferase Ste14